MSPLYEHAFTATDGEIISLEMFRGNVLLIVNTATRCGLARQFRELQTLQDDYASQGLVVIGFPCNQFAGQEPETNESVAQVCEVNFGVSFLLSQKIDVNGPHTHPLFTYLKTHSKSALGHDIKWNFTKFLVSKDGQTVQRFAPTTSPEALRATIEKMLIR